MNAINKIGILVVSFLIIAIITLACSLSSSPSRNPWWGTQTECLAPDFGDILSDADFSQNVFNYIQGM